MKRFITVLFCAANLVTLVSYAPVGEAGNGETAVMAPMAPMSPETSALPPTTGERGVPGQMAVPSETELLSVIESEDFKTMAREMGIDVSKMSPEEKNSIVKEARGFAQEFTNLPPETQAELMKEIAPEQITKQVEQEPAPAPAVLPPAPVPTPVSTPLPAPKTEQPKKPTVSLSRIAEGKNTINKLVKYIEDIELKFESLARVTPDPVREQRWASLNDDLQWTVAALHSMSNNPTLLEHFASTDAQVLYSQTHTMQRTLKSLRKKLVVPDTAKLRAPAGIDAARAEVVSDRVKESSKQAATSIIDTIDRDLPSIRMGTKKLFETYAADELKKVEASLKTKKESAPEKRPGSMYRKDSTGFGGGYGTRDSGYSPSSYSPSSSESARSGLGSEGAGAPGVDKGKKEFSDKEKKEKEDTEKKKKEEEQAKKEQKEQEGTEETGKKKSAKEQYKYDKEELRKWLNQDLERANKEADKILKEATEFANDASEANAKRFIDAVGAETPEATEFAQVFVRLGYIMGDLLGKFKKSDKDLDEFYTILDKDGSMKKLAHAYATYEENYTRFERIEHEERARNILEFYADKYQSVIRAVRTQKTLETLVQDAQKKLKALLLDGEEDENGIRHKIITAETHPALDPSATIDVADHAVTLLEREEELIRSFEDPRVRKERADQLLRDITKPVGYFTHNVMQHLDAITHRAEDDQEIKLLQAASTPLVNRITGLEATGTLNPVAPSTGTRAPTTAAPTASAPTAPITARAPAPASAAAPAPEPGFLSRFFSGHRAE